MTQPNMRIPVGIPLIGQGPAPEEMRQAQSNAELTVLLKPIHAYPVAKGPDGVPHFWPGITLFDQFAQEAMKLLGTQLGAKSRTDEELVELCRHAWKIALIMLQTRPVIQMDGQREGNGPSTEPPNSATT